MINMFVACLVAIFSVQIFTLTYRLGGINRTFVSMPISLIEKSIPIYEEGVRSLYIDQETLEKSVNSYIFGEISKFTENYSLSYYYYSTADGLICKTEYCDGVRITLNAEVMFAFHYHKTMYYEVQKN